MSHREAPASAGHPSALEAGCFAAMPLLASTHFCMDVLLRGPVLDLRSACEVLTFDPCALLRLYALVAEEFPVFEDRPQQLGECVIALGRAGLARALYHAPSTWEQQGRLCAFAAHGVQIARCAGIAASTLGLCEDTAYVVGLLHAIGTLPSELGWTLGPLSAEDATQIAASIARLHQLPPLLTQALHEIAARDEASLWAALIEAAHQLADGGVSAGSGFEAP